MQRLRSSPLTISLGEGMSLDRHTCVCVCVCVREREREKRASERARERACKSELMGELCYYSDTQRLLRCFQDEGLQTNRCPPLLPSISEGSLLVRVGLEM